MIDYRLFLMTDGRIRGATEFQAESDKLAVARAEILRAGDAAELWNRARRVAAFALGTAPQRPAARNDAHPPVSATSPGGGRLTA